MIKNFIMNILLIILNITLQWTDFRTNILKDAKKSLSNKYYDCILLSCHLRVLEWIYTR